MKLIRPITTLFILVLAAFDSIAQLSASFTSSAISGCPNAVISFNNTSIGATSYSWNFGNGSPTSANVSPSTTYPNPGTFPVKLTAYNGNDSSIATTTITIYPLPTVSFTASDTLVCPGFSVTFNNTSNSGTPGTPTYNWNFGDGTSSNAQNPSHVFPGPNYYIITLTVTNSQGCSNTYTSNAYIHVATPPVAAFSVNNTLFCKTPAQAIFSNSSSGTATLTYQWNFGDGSPINTATAPTHNYAASSTYTVTLTVTDGNGCKDTLVKPAYIKVDNLSGSISSPDSACVLQSLSFIENANATVSSSWTFGDGGSAYTDTTSHIYGGPGTYQVVLLINDGTCLDTIVKPVYIRPKPTIGISYTPQHPCPSPVTVNFTATAPVGSTYLWSFGDGTPNSISANPAHQYVNNGFVADAHGGFDSVILTVTDSHGCVNSMLDTMKIYDLQINPGEFFHGCTPLTVHFTKPYPVTFIPYPPPIPPNYYLSPDTPIQNYSWDFGDGSPVSSLATPIHIYSSYGVYHPVVTVTTPSGCVATDTLLINAGVKPTLTSFTANPTTLCKRDTVKFEAHAVGDTPFMYLFVPGDLAFNFPVWTLSADTIYRHSYGYPGTFQAYVVASNYGCNSDTSARIMITVDSPYSAFSDNEICSPRTGVGFFSNLSVGATSFLWLFGDGDTSTQANPVHNYPALGNWTPKLVAYNSRTGCTDTSAHTIHLFDLNPLFDDTTICKNATVNFLPSFGYGPLVPTIFKWYIDTVLIDSVSNIPTPLNSLPNVPFISDTNFIYTFSMVQQHSIRLILTDSFGCADTVTRNLTVAKPADTFSATPLLACLPATVHFTDQSWFITSTHFASAYWDFGDATNNTVSTDTTSHHYNTTGVFNIEEIVTDNVGCTDTLVKYAYITIDKPTSAFNVIDSFPCKGDSLFFNNYSFNNIVSSWWNFGDGDTSNVLHPTHTYQDTGSYTVTLIVRDAAGCKDTLVKPAYIQMTKPHASFTMNDSTGICIPLIINFNNTSTGANTYAWNFGNNNSSPAFSPTNSYTVPGHDTIMLIATNAHGCKDTAYHHAVLYGYAGSVTYSPLTGCRPLLVNFTANVLNLPFLRFDFNDGTVSAVSAVTTATHTYTTPGAYVPKLIMSDSNGCLVSSSGLDTIKVDSVAARFNETPSSLCIYETVKFTDSSKSMFSFVTSWQWLFSDGTGSSQPNPLHLFDSSGTSAIRLIVTDGIGCKDTLVKTVTVYPMPILTTTGDTTICVGDKAPISVTANVPLTAWSWSPSATLTCGNCQSTLASPPDTTLYIVNGTDAQGCSNTDSVVVNTIKHVLAKVGPGGPICLGQSITLSDSGGRSYIWYPSTGLNSTNIPNPVASPQTSIVYTVVTMEASCIPDTSKVTITVNPLPNVSTGPDQTIIAGNTTTITATATNIARYLWSPADGLSCDSCANSAVHVEQTTVFTITVYSKEGCSDSAKVTVNVICDHKQVFIPNTFTPNGDGQNDVFFPRGQGLKIIKWLRVYDRWGELIFERGNINLNDETSGWDGTSKGNKPRPDVYVYTIDAICETGAEINWKGDVTLLR